MINGLYNKAINMTSKVLKNAKLELKKRNNSNLILSRHTIEQCNQSWKRKYMLNINYNNLLQGEIIEVEVKNNAIHKVIIRVRMDNQYDMCIVVNLFNDNTNAEELLVKTIWLNSLWDIHMTIDKSKYVLV